MKHSITAIKAPSNLGLMPPYKNEVPGVYRLPDALENTGIFSRLSVESVKEVSAPAYHPEIDREWGIRNAKAIRDYSISLANVIEASLRDDKFPLVIGGDCSILLGSALALRRMGRYGLLFVDGHTDFQTAKTSQTGGAAGMDLALATGYGASLLTEIEGYKPFIAESDAIAFGFRDMDDPETYYARLIFETDIQLYSLDTVRKIGIKHSINQCIKHFQQSKLDGIWLHIDADVLDDAIMPAVDSRQNGGMSYDELIIVIQALLQSQLLMGMQITIIDPDLDSDGQIIKGFADQIVKALHNSP